MVKRSRPAHAREEAPTLQTERLLASPRWRERVGTAPAALEALERSSHRSVKSRIARAVRAPALASGAVFAIAVIIAIILAMVSTSVGSDALSEDAFVEEEGVDGSTAMSASGADGQAASAAVSAAPHVYVHVVGEVREPGVVKLNQGARVHDAIDAAGGVTDAAVLTAVNLARAVADGEQIVIPDAQTAEEWPTGGSAAELDNLGGSAPAPSDATLVNLNTADAAQLETLPRVGPALASRILDWREQNGGFSSVDQLLDISGIGEKTLAGFRDRVTV